MAHDFFWGSVDSPVSLEIISRLHGVKKEDYLASGLLSGSCAMVLWKLSSNIQSEESFGYAI